mmetsp:Transcript_14413/g.28390  ORF Transcript_14413/g.28390 Transcript_14413/m.28390 type:complete len:1440 (+) Transcript_14413:428-4747(+)
MRTARLDPLDDKIARIFSSPNSSAHHFSCPGFESSARESCSYSEKYYYRNANLLLRLRVARTTCHPDISPSEAMRALGSAEHLFGITTQQRRDLARLARYHRALQMSINALCHSVDGGDDAFPEGDKNIDVREPDTMGLARWLEKTRAHVDGLVCVAKTLAIVLDTVRSVPSSSALLSDKGNVDHQVNRSFGLTSIQTANDVIGRVTQVQQDVHRLMQETVPPLAVPLPTSVRYAPYHRTVQTLNNCWKRMVDVVSSRHWHDVGLHSQGSKSAQILTNAAQKAFREQFYSSQEVGDTGAGIEGNDPHSGDSLECLITELKLSAQNLFKICRNNSESQTEHDNKLKATQKTEDLDDSYQDSDSLQLLSRAASSSTGKGTLYSEHRYGRMLLQAMRLDKVIRALESHTKSCKGLKITSAKSIRILLLQLVLSVEKVSSIIMNLHCRSSKLLYVILRLGNSLFARGFCRPPDAEEGSGDDGDDDGPAEGTGMGEGDTSGAQDVSNEIMDEEQLLGTKQDQEPSTEQNANEQRNDDEEKVDPEQGLEMEQDFEGDMHDLPDEGDNDEDDDDQEEEEELDREMGELGEDKQAVDEKLWEESSDDEDNKENEKDEEEKIEKDAPVKGGDNIETAAKDDDGDDGQNDDDNNDDDQQNEESKAPKDQEPDKPEDEEEENQDHRINDADEQYEENTGNDPMEFPEEMNLDDADEEDKDGDNEEKDDDDIGEKDEGGPEDDASDDQEQEADKEGQMGNDDEDEEGKDVPPESISLEDSDGGNSPAQEEDPEPEDQEDKSNETLQNMEQEKEDDGKEEEEAKGEDGIAKIDDGEEAMNQEEVSGDIGNQAQGSEQKEEDNAVQSGGQADDDANDGADAEGHEAKDTIADAGAKEGSWQPSAPTDEVENDSNDQQQRDKQASINKLMQEPNPYRSLGDALKKWHERLDMVGEDSKDDDPVVGDKENEKEEESGMDEEKAAATGGKFEHVGADEKADTQVAAAADDDEAKEGEFQPPERDEEEKEEEPDRIKADGTEPDDMENKENGQGNDDDDQEQKTNVRGGKRRLPKMDITKDDNERDHEEDMEEEKDEADESAQGQEEDTPRLEDGEDALPATVVGESADQLFEHKRGDVDLIVTDEEKKNLREEIERAMRHSNKASSDPTYAQQWEKLALVTGALSRQLCEQLRAILEPISATRLKGDYRSGKRINIKKIIPYIASQFRKDKIWMRRTKPNKRDYQVMIAIDDSESMRENSAGSLALEALATLTQALTLLEVGEISVVSFGDTVNIVHPFGKPFSDQSGAHALSQFKFEQKNTEWSRLVKGVIEVLEHAKMQQGARASKATVSCLQLVFVISDARIQQDRELVSRWCREAFQRRQLLVMLIVDSPDPKKSILKLRSVTYPNGKLKIVQYLEDFPFPFYVILRDLNQLPEIVADTLKQWFELIQHSST